MSVQTAIRMIANVPLSCVVGSAKTDVSDPISTLEIVVNEILLERFSPDVLESELDGLLKSGVKRLAEMGCTDPKACAVQVAIHLSSNDGIRPALHLSQAVVQSLATVGASLDFDPYCT